MRHLIAVLTALGLVWPCHAVEPYDTLRVLRNWEWQVVDIYDPGDADLMRVPEPPEGAVSVKSVTTALNAAEEHSDDILDDFAASDRHFNTVHDKFPLSSTKDLADPDILWLLEFEAPTINELRSQIAHPHWSLGGPDEEFDYIPLISAPRYCGRAAHVAMVRGDYTSAAELVAINCNTVERITNSVSSNQIYLIVTISAKEINQEAVANSYLRYQPLTDREAFEAVRAAHAASQLSNQQLMRSISGEHRFFVNQLNQFDQAEDLIKVAIELHSAYSFNPFPVTESWVGRKITSIVKDYIFQPNRTREQVAAIRRHDLERYNRPLPEIWNDIKGSADPGIFDAPSTNWHSVLAAINGNSIFDVAQTQSDRAMPTLFATHFLSTAASHDLIQLAFAIRLYQIDHNERLPKSLKGLVPDYLETLPVDPFSDRQYGFRTDGDEFVLWSIGKDGEDQEGKISKQLMEEKLKDAGVEIQSNEWGEDIPHQEVEDAFHNTSLPLPSLWYDNDIILRLPIRPAPYPSGK